MNFDVDIEAFAEEQGAVQRREEHGLHGPARSALRKWGKDGWYDSLLARAEGLLRQRYRAESGMRTSPLLREAVDAFTAQAKKMLDKTKEPTPESIESQATAIAASLSTDAINAAIETAAHDSDVDDKDLEKVWLSREDEKVRPTHAAAHGQAVPLDKKFKVGRSRLSRPGDTRAAIGEWIQCRCVMAVRRREDAEAVVASAEEHTSIGIFGVVADDDPVREKSSEDIPHITLVWMGDSADFEGDLDTIASEVAAVAKGVPPVTLDVTSREPLGDDEADVLMVSPGDMGDIRDDLLAQPGIKAGHDNAEQFPQWTPHVTLGYPDTPALQPDVGAPNKIRFDRLALWVGEERTEFPLDGEAMDPENEQQPVEDEEFPPLAESERVAAADDPIPFWGVLAPEDTLSGDGRKFSAGALRARPLPLPLSWQKVNEPGHDGSVVVANIERAWRRDGKTYGYGHFLSSVPETDEAIGIMSEIGSFGVSIDADDGTMQMEMRDGRTLDEVLEEMPPDSEMEIGFDELITNFTSARICGATLCHIPAFHEARIQLGEVPEEFAPQDGEDLVIESLAEQQEAAAAVTAAVSEKSWDGSASRFTDEEWKRSCVLHLADTLTKSDHKLPIKEPNGDLSRAGVHAAAGRLDQVDAPDAKKASARSALRSAYKTLGEDPPDSLTAAGPVKTEDGPGWVTHPVDTDRLRDYWVRGKGAAKINWGTPGDFNRCRAAVAQYVKAQHINGYCANRHYDALGFWPGRPVSAETIAASAAAGEKMAPSISLVAGGANLDRPPMEWFENPNLTGPSPIVVTEEGRVFGHLATWGTCHIGIADTCVTPPPSMSSYAYFHTGAVLTDAGEVACGKITMDTGHADIKASASATTAHYDNTGMCGADVCAGEDEYGIWVAGAVRPEVPQEKYRTLRAAALSGDWRRIAGHLELVAALCVNTPGFPIPRPALAASAGHQESLVASNIVMAPPKGEPLTVESIANAVLAKMEQQQREKEQARRELQSLAARRDLAALKKERSA